MFWLFTVQKNPAENTLRNVKDDQELIITTHENMVNKTKINTILFQTSHWYKK